MNTPMKYSTGSFFVRSEFRLCILLACVDFVITPSPRTPFYVRSIVYNSEIQCRNMVCMPVDASHGVAGSNVEYKWRKKFDERLEEIHETREHTEASL